MHYSYRLPPYWSLQVHSLPSSSFCGSTLPWKILLNLHHHIPSTFQWYTQRHPPPFFSPFLKRPLFFHHGGWWLENSQTLPLQKGPHILGKEKGPQKHIYGLRVISSEYLASFMKSAAILHKNMIHSGQNFSLNLLFEKFPYPTYDLPRFPPFICTKYSDFLHFQSQCCIPVLYKNTP